MTEIPLFQTIFLRNARFPILDKRGRTACQHEIKTWTMEKFLEDGWATIQQTDGVLYKWLERLISIEIEGYNNITAETVSRSIRFGAALIYYPLALQAENSNSEFVLPIAAESQEGALRFDLRGNDSQSFGEFLLTFDEDLAAILGGFIGDSILLNGLKVTRDEIYLGAFFTYFVLANRAEELGMNTGFTIIE